MATSNDFQNHRCAQCRFATRYDKKGKELKEWKQDWHVRCTKRGTYFPSLNDYACFRFQIRPEYQLDEIRETLRANGIVPADGLW